jgi:hypothetical protein
MSPVRRCGRYSTSSRLSLITTYHNTFTKKDARSFLRLLSSSVVQWFLCLPLDPRFEGSNPAEGDKNPQHAFFEEEVRPSAPCHKTLRHEYEQRYFLRANSFPSPVTSALLLYESAGWISRKLWWTNQGFSPVDIIPPWISMLISHLRDKNRHVGGFSSGT